VEGRDSLLASSVKLAIGGSCTDVGRERAAIAAGLPGRESGKGIARGERGAVGREMRFIGTGVVGRDNGDSLGSSTGGIGDG
jgi:hypothetical protein